MHSREILFRQTGDGCQWLLSNDCAGFLKGDELELVLLMQDTNFIRITQLEDYRPQSFYRLALPENSREIFPNCHRKYSPAYFPGFLLTDR